MHGATGDALAVNLLWLYLCPCPGLFPHAARRQANGRYKVIATGQVIALHPSSTMRGKAPECVVFSELVVTTK